MPLTPGASASPPSPRSGKVVEVWFPALELGPVPEGATAPVELIAAEGIDDLRQVRRAIVRAAITLDQTPADTADAYLRLHLLSHRLVRPHGVNLDGIFAKLPIKRVDLARPNSG